MTIIQDVLARLETVNHPVAQVIQKGHDFRILAVGFKKGMVMKDHKASMPAVLTVLTGSVVYLQGDVSNTLKQYEEQHIPVEVIHSVMALEDSLCLLTKGKP
jgi:quercetin dioxygenase-like cupin family protein